MSNSIDTSSEIDLYCCNLSNIMYDAAKLSLKHKSVPCANNHKKRWSDREYSSLKREVNAIGRKIKLSPFDKTLYIKFNQLKKQLNKLRKNNIKKYRNSILSKLSELENKNPKEFWNLLKELKSKKNKNTINPDDYAKYFSELYKPHPNSAGDNIILNKIHNLSHNSTYVEELDKEISEGELYESCKLLKKNKACGPDLIINEMVMSGISVLSKSIKKLFNSIIESGYFPQNWGLGYIVPIHKGGDVNELSNYRAISITSCMSKYFTLILNQRLDTFFENNDILNKEQIGFKKGCRTSDHIFVLKTLIDQYKKNKIPLFSCFVDFSKAFDTVWRDGLYYKMLKVGVSSKMTQILKSMYNNVKSQIKVNTNLSKKIEILNGTRQGCNLSPNLFKLYINDLPKALNSCHSDPVRLYDIFINVLMYADDIVILSTSKSGLQHCLNILNQYCKKWKLKVNIKKTKIVIFNKYKTNHFKFTFGSWNIDIVENYCYLGMNIHKSGNFKSGIKALSNKALNAYYSWLSVLNGYKNSSPSMMRKVFDSTISPIALYGSEIWGAYLPDLVNNKLINALSKGNFSFEKPNIRLCKNILGVKKSTSNDASKAELGIFPLIINVMVNILKYYARLHTVNKNSLVYKAFLSNKSVNESNYIKSVCNISNYFDIKHLDIIDKIMPSTIKMIKKKMKDKYIMVFKNSFQNLFKHDKTSKLRTFKLVKRCFRVEPYIELIKDFQLRQSFSKLRLSDHCLNIETGRKHNIDVEDRICNICDSKEVGDEFHFLIKCQNLHLKELRDKLYVSVSKKVKQFKLLKDFDKFLYLFCGCDHSIILDTCIYIKKGFDIIKNI